MASPMPEFLKQRLLDNPNTFTEDSVARAIMRQLGQPAAPKAIKFLVTELGLDKDAGRWEVAKTLLLARLRNSPAGALAPFSEIRALACDDLAELATLLLSLPPEQRDVTLLLAKIHGQDEVRAAFITWADKLGDLQPPFLVDAVPELEGRRLVVQRLPLFLAEPTA